MAKRSVTNFVCGEKYNLCLSEEGSVFSSGTSNFGAHGYPVNHLILPPKKISSLKHIISIATGKDHSVCLDIDGNVFTFGSNQFGQLGIGFGDSNNYCIPQKVNLPSCKQVSCGYRFTICLSDDNSLYSFGFNNYGQLGIGNNDDFQLPQKVESLTNVEFIECGGSHVFCKTLNNKIYCWGYAQFGRLGIQKRENHNTPILCSSIPNENIVDIKCGHAHTLLLTSIGDVFSCGNNMNRQTGIQNCQNYSVSLFTKIEGISEITRIECGFDYSLCIDRKNDFYVFGSNFKGQLGINETSSCCPPTKHPILSKIIDISRGGTHTFAKTSENEIFGFGENYACQLGFKGHTQRTPIRVFEDNEDIWYTNISKPSKAKSARSVLPRPNQEDNSPPKKKQKIQ